MDLEYAVEVSNISEYIKEINKISPYLRPKNVNEETKEKANLLWYRGQGNVEHILLPGLLREWNDDKKVSPLEYEVALLDTFCARSTHVLESDMSS